MQDRHLQTLQNLYLPSRVPKINWQKQTLFHIILSMTEKYDAIFVGTGFASTFFLLPYLHQSKQTARILVLEQGRIDPLAWQVENRRTSSLDANQTFVNNSRKKWVYNPSFGGGSNCWWACTPRMMPNDFILKSRYGVGVDWPLTYDELDPFYAQAEAIMSISGPDDGAPFPRKNRYPQPPHRFTDPDKLLKAAYPNQFFQQPTARASAMTKNRPKCCASGVCGLCPIDAKFTILNEMKQLYEDERIMLLLEATAMSIETSGGIAKSVRYSYQGKEHIANAELIILGANALFNPFLLLKSNIQHPLLGKRLNEQLSINATVDLDGVDNFQGSTSITGHGYMLYDGEHRKHYAATLMETWNIPTLRLQKGKWRQRMALKFIFESLPHEQNYVKISNEHPNLPETVFIAQADYTLKAITQLSQQLPKLLTPLPVEQIHIAKEHNPTEAHILGTTIMGDDPQTSVIDRYLMHHEIRNLLILGGGAFPTSPPANPTLTISALSLWAAHHL